MDDELICAVINSIKNKLKIIDNKYGTIYVNEHTYENNVCTIPLSIVNDENKLDVKLIRNIIKLLKIIGDYHDVSFDVCLANNDNNSRGLIISFMTKIEQKKRFEQRANDIGVDPKLYRQICIHNGEQYKYVEITKTWNLDSFVIERITDGYRIIKSISNKYKDNCK